MQAAFDGFESIHVGDHMDTDMQALFYLFSTAPDADAVSEPHGEVLGASTTHEQQSPASAMCGVEGYCFPDIITVSGSLPSLKIKQEPPEPADVCDSSPASASSSGGSPFAITATSHGSPVHAPSTAFFSDVHDVLLPPTGVPEDPKNSYPSEKPGILSASAVPAAACTMAGLSESKPDEALLPTQSDSTDALYDIALSKPSNRAFGRTSSKKPPLSHSTIEKHRRDRINHLIEELGEMVPATDPRYRGEGADSAGLKRPKHAVLADVVTRYRQLQVENESLRRQLAAAGLQPASSGVQSGSGAGSVALPCQGRSGLETAQPAAVPQLGSVPSPAIAQPSCQLPAAAQAPALPSSTSEIASGPVGGHDAGQTPAAPDSATQEAAPAAAAAAAPPAASLSTTNALVRAASSPSPAAAVAAMTSLLSQAAAATGSSGPQLQAALNLPLFKAAAVAAAAAAAAAPLPGFVPVAASNPPVAAAAGLCSLYSAAAAGAVVAAGNTGLQVPAMAPAVRMSTAAAAPQPSALNSLPISQGIRPADCTTATPAAVPASSKAMVVDATAAAVPPATSSDVLPTKSDPMTSPTGGTESSDGSDSSSTEVHVCRKNAIARLKMTAVPGPGKPRAAGTATTPAAAAVGSQPCWLGSVPNDAAHLMTSSPSLCPTESPSCGVPLGGSATSAAPPSPASAATAATAADAAGPTSSWLVRVVCPPRKDLLSAACGALSEAGVSLRSVRVASAPCGRMALELEVCCEEGVLPRGMQVGHIQCAIHAALQASAGAAGDGEDAGAQLALPPQSPPSTQQQQGRTATSSRGANVRKRLRV